MKKSLLLIALAISTASHAQNVFTFGKNSVSKEEFLRAFSKNNNPTQDRKTALQEYLTLYTNFKLKVQAAKDLKLDTTPTQVADYRNFRRQIEENYMNDEALMNQMLKEAFNRSQKDLRLSHIFVPVDKKNPADSVAALSMINQAYAALKSGKSFEEVALQYSKDESAAYNRGDLGYITVFSLPYQMETVAYNTAKGNFSAPFRSKNGYHIFKVTDERSARGKIRVAQVFFVFSPEVNEDERKRIASRADSVYQLLQKGAKWDEIVSNYSQDRNTVYMGGTVKDFGVGEYEPVFENTAFALEKENDISKPFATSYGYHILRLIEKYPVETDWQRAAGTGILKQLVSNDARSSMAKEKFNDEVIKTVGIKTQPYDEKSLFDFVDTVMASNEFKNVGKINPNTVLFILPKLNVKAGDFARYVRAIKNSGQKDAEKSYKELLPEYTRTATLEYYRNHLEEYNKDFKYQLQEFREGNLLFEIMEKNVWNKAVTDSTGQLSYYDQHKANYKWQSSIAAIIVTANDKETAMSFRDSLMKNGIANWRNAVDAYNGKLMADSGRFERNQIQVRERIALEKGVVTLPVVNEQDGSASFAYITASFPDNEQRSFDDARGMVINDYQLELEEKWITELKKKYPVKVDDKVWAEIISGK